MSEQERVQILREFLDSLLLGAPVFWYVAALFVASLAAMACIVMDGRRKHKLNVTSKNNHKNTNPS